MKKILGIITILIAVSIALQFFIYGFSDAFAYKVTPNIDDNGNIAKYEVEIVETKVLYDLKDFEVNLLWFTVLSLSASSIVYVYFTLARKDKSRSTIDILSQENEILKKQIENNELKDRLKGISSTIPENPHGEIEVDKENKVYETQNSNDTFEQQKIETIECFKCKTVIANTYRFCPKCGNPLNESIAHPKRNSEVDVKSILTEGYSSGVITTFIWSTVLTLITILVYTFKGTNSTDRAMENLAQGILGRPLVVLLIAFIISLFFKPKENQIKKFNSVSTYAMGALTIGELGRWIVIGHS